MAVGGKKLNVHDIDLVIGNLVWNQLGTLCWILMQFNGLVMLSILKLISLKQGETLVDAETSHPSITHHPMLLML